MLLKGAHAVCCFKGRRDDGAAGVLGSFPLFLFWLRFVFAAGYTILSLSILSFVILTTCAYEIRNAMTESIITTFAFALRIT
jgi:hypothetical protein